MSDKNRNPLSDFNWGQFEQFFGGKLPAPNHLNGPHSSWIENYVQDVLKQSMPSVNISSLKKADPHFQTDFFDTHNSVIIKIHIPDRTVAKQLRVRVSSNRVKLECLPDDAEQTIRLSNLIVPGSCKGVYKNGILQLHMRKQTADKQFREIDVQFP